ncbi:MAG: Asp-tRNA(Asn)/Glu-tRNA(Gln) amidotransferase subunit GatC [archaeon]
MNVDKSLILHVAEVARLSLTEKEVSEFLPQLQEILNAFSEIQKVDTKNTLPSFHPVELKDSMREDVIGECLQRDIALKNTLHKDGYFKGPKVI